MRTRSPAGIALVPLLLGVIMAAPVRAQDAPHGGGRLQVAIAVGGTIGGVGYRLSGDLPLRGRLGIHLAAGRDAMNGGGNEGWGLWHGDAWLTQTLRTKRTGSLARLGVGPTFIAPPPADRVAPAVMLGIGVNTARRLTGPLGYTLDFRYRTLPFNGGELGSGETGYNDSGIRQLWYTVAAGLSYELGR